MTDVTVQAERQKAERKELSSTDSFDKEKQAHDEPQVLLQDADDTEAAKERRAQLYARLRPFLLGGLAALILAWWISATVLKATRHRW